LFRVSPLLPPLPPLRIVDVGAMSIGQETEPYAPLLRTVSCEVVGFEPIAAELEKLNALHRGQRRFLPYVIGDGSPQIFHECSHPMTSSLLEPDSDLVARFQNLEELMRVTKRYPVETKRLDDIAEVKGADFLKVDVQGGELLVLQGAVQTLKEVLVVQTEIEFVALYKKQPLFADIDSFLRQHGFQIHRIWTSGRTFKPLIHKKDPDAMASQLLWGEAVYVRDFMTFDRLIPLALLKLAVILHENYRSFDIAALALEMHDRQTGSRLQTAYLQKLTGQNLTQHPG
jgi:FkbM family methyltransferase